MSLNGAQSQPPGVGNEPTLKRADELQDLIQSVSELVVPFVRAADDDASQKSKGHGMAADSQHGPRTVLVEEHPPEKLVPLLDLQVHDKGVGKEGLVKMVERVLKYSVNTWDQGFMDKLYASTTPVGVVSDLVLSVLNTNSHVYQVSPALTLIEKHCGKLLADLFGFKSPHAGGVSQPGGSASNSSAMVIARNTLFPETKSDGIGSRKFVIFTSQHGHYSMEKAAQMFGFGSKSVRSVNVDWDGRMSPSDLEAKIKAAKEAGETPFFVNATAGTTVLGSFDPIDRISPICKAHNLWLHIDGSWGGSVVMNPSLKASRLAGIENADSVAITPHKMLQIPTTCSFLVVQDLRIMHKSMTLPAGYLFHNNDPDREVWDLADLTPQCGRRPDSIKFYLSLHYYGLEYWSNFIGRAFDVAQYFYTTLANRSDFVTIPEKPKDLVNGSSSAAPIPQNLQICFYYTPANLPLSSDPDTNSKRTAELTKRLVAKGFMVDYAPGEKGKFFRVVVNGGTRKGTVDGFITALEAVGKDMSA